MITFKPLRRTLVEKDMTVSDLAKLMGIDVSTLGNFINGGITYKGRTYDVSLSHVEKICKVLDCSVDKVIRND